MAGKRETTRVSYYFLKEKKILAMTALSGILYNLGLVAVPWFEGHISQYLADILEGTRQPSSLAALALGKIDLTSSIYSSGLVREGL